MHEITALETQKHDQERVSVFLDDPFAFGISAMLASARNLSVGRELSAEEIDVLKADDTVERAYSAALNFLSYRPRSRQEVKLYLMRKKIDPAVSTAVLVRLERQGLVDDREFAKYWIENRQMFRPRGSRALRMELRQKGISNELIVETMEEQTDDERSAVQAGLKKARSFGDLNEDDFFRKMVGHLQRRGFPYDIAARVSRKLYDESAAADFEG